MTSLEIARGVFFQHVEGARDLWPLVERFIIPPPPPAPSYPLLRLNYTCCFCLRLVHGHFPDYHMVCAVERGIDDVQLATCSNCFGLFFDIQGRSPMFCAWHRLKASD